MTRPSSVSTSTDWWPGEWPGVGHDTHAREDLGLAVVLDVVRPLELDPLHEVAGRARGFELGTLHVDRYSREQPVAAAVVEVQVRVDHAQHLARDHVRIEPDAPLLVQLGRRVDHPGIDEHAPVRVVDDVKAVRPALALEEDVAVPDRANVVERHRRRLSPMATTAVERKLLVDGEWIETGDWVEVRSPYSGEVVGRVAKAGAAEARARVDAAARAMASRCRRTSGPRSSSASPGYSAGGTRRSRG